MALLPVRALRACGTRFVNELFVSRGVAPLAADMLQNRLHRQHDKFDAIS